MKTDLPSKLFLLLMLLSGASLSTASVHLPPRIDTCLSYMGNSAELTKTAKSTIRNVVKFVDDHPKGILNMRAILYLPQNLKREATDSILRRRSKVLASAVHKAAKSTSPFLRYSMPFEYWLSDNSSKCDAHIFIEYFDPPPNSICKSGRSNCVITCDDEECYANE